jgi:hypothetical protein
MGTATPVAKSVRAPEFGKVIVEASDGTRYHADLQKFSSVHCYPKTEDEWRTVSIDSYGLALIWTTRFEVHMDQVVALAFKKEYVARTA